MKYKKLVLASFLAFSSFLSAEEEEAAPPSNFITLTPEQLDGKEIDLKEVKGGKLHLGINRRGKIAFHPDRIAYVIPQISGVIVDAKKNVGDNVEVNEVLVVLQSKELAEIEADYLQALNKESATSALYAKEAALHAKQLNSEQDYINALSAANEAKLNSQILRQKLKVLGLAEEEINALHPDEVSKLGIYTLRSPINGKVIDRNGSKGQYKENNTTLYTVADLDKVWIEIGVYPKDTGTIKPGQKIQVSKTSGNETAHAKLVAVSPLIAEDTILAKVIAELDNEEGQWVPGGFVNAYVITDSPKVDVSVPVDAIQTIDGQTCVFVQSGEGYEKRIVKVGRCDGKHTEVVSGLEPGEKIPTQNTFIFKAELGKNSFEPED